MWSGNILAMDAKQYNALSSQEKKWLHEAADAYGEKVNQLDNCLLYTSPSPRDRQKSRMPSSA